MKKTPLVGVFFIRGAHGVWGDFAAILPKKLKSRVMFPVFSLREKYFFF
jgi:hypothetical protein